VLNPDFSSSASGQVRDKTWKWHFGAELKRFRRLRLPVKASVE